MPDRRRASRGLLGDRIGLRATMFVIAAGFAVSVLLVVASPVAEPRTLPDELSEKR